jgi:GntR family transcriptional regulator of arabinose operon
MTLGVTKNRVELEHQQLVSLMNKGVDGIIVEGNRSALPNPNLHLYRELTEKGIPYVFINGLYEALDPVFVCDERQGRRQPGSRLFIQSRSQKNRRYFQGG